MENSVALRACGGIVFTLNSLNCLRHNNTTTKKYDLQLLVMIEMCRLTAVAWFFVLDGSITVTQ